MSDLSFQIFEQTDFNKKHKAVSFKPLNFTCALKLSKVQVQERSFKVSVTIYALSGLKYKIDCLHYCILNGILVGNPNRKKVHIFGFVGIFEYIC